MKDPRLADLNFREIVDYGGSRRFRTAIRNPWPVTAIVLAASARVCSSPAAVDWIL